VSGGGGNGAGAIGVSQSFHTWMLAGEEARFGRAGSKAVLESAEKKIMLV
jgi:Na+/citrate or Na+/malate symporter